jgi:hypothetical protein
MSFRETAAGLSFAAGVLSSSTGARGGCDDSWLSLCGAVGDPAAFSLPPLQATIEAATTAMKTRKAGLHNLCTNRLLARRQRRCRRIIVGILKAVN